MKDLTIALQVYAYDLNESGNDAQAISSRVKSRIENHIKKRIEDGLSKDALSQQLNDLNMDGLIPADISDWCYDKLDEFFKEQNEKASESKDSSSDDLSEDLPPVHFEDAVYHASLCGFVLSNQSPKKGSNDVLSRCGHNFDEVSISVSGNMRMLIAHQENTVYISFMQNEHIWEGIFLYTSN